MLLRMNGKARTHDYTKDLWGHALYGVKFEDRKSGWWPLRKTRQVMTCVGHGCVREGDDILRGVKTEAGSMVARFRCTRISYLGNPDDMFEAEFEFIGEEK